MNVDTCSNQIEDFLARVMEVEEKYAFTKKGLDTARKDELRALLDTFCK